jgi:predicted hydrocarbon binding protein
VVERENLRPGWSLCLFARGILWYFLQKTVSPKAKVDIVKPGYKACLCKLSNAKVEGELNMRSMDYEEFVTKTEEFFVVLLKGLTSALYKILGEPAKGYLVTAGKFAGYAHSSALPLVDEDWSAAMELLSNFLLIWKGQVKLGDGVLVLEEEKYEFVVPKDDLICHLFYGYVAGLLSGVTGKNINFDDYGCGNKKVIQVE